MAPEIELRHLRYFLAVAQHRHFGRAAADLGIQQPPLSQQIQRLEFLLGYRVFERTPKGAVLTAAGAALVPVAQRTLADLGSGLSQVQRIATGESGHLRIGFAASLMFTRLPSAIRAFRTEHPGISLELKELTTTAQIDALERDIIDVGLLREASLGEPYHSDLILAEPFVAVLPRRHALSRHREIRIAQLASEPFVLFPRIVGPAFHDRITGLCRQAGFVPHIVQEAVEWQSVISLVGAGLGVSIVPGSVAGAIRAQAVTRPLRPIARTLVYLVRRANAGSPATENFLQMLTREMGRTN